MQNLTQNKLEQITKMQNQSRAELEQIAKMRRVKGYKNMSKKGLLIALLKSGQSLAELYNKVEETKQYPDHDGLDYKWKRKIENLFDKINEDYYKPVKTNGAFNDNYIEYKSRGDKDKNLSPKEYLDNFRPYLRDMINHHRAPLEGSLDNDLHGEWKIQLTIQINFVSSSDPGEIRTMGSKSKNIEILMVTETDDIINELFESFLQKYQELLEEKMRDSKFVFESVVLLYYSLHKTTIEIVGIYIESYE